MNEYFHLMKKSRIFVKYLDFCAFDEVITLILVSLEF